jgi:hypothetical protein
MDAIPSSRNAQGIGWCSITGVSRIIVLRRMTSLTSIHDPMGIPCILHLAPTPLGLWTLVGGSERHLERRERDTRAANIAEQCGTVPDMKREGVVQ